MTQNEVSAANLETWNEIQQQMKASAEDRLQGLICQKAYQQQHSNASSARTWLDDAIDREQGLIDHLVGSIALASKCRALALENKLHDPRCG